MILHAIAAKLSQRSKADFKGRHFEATLIVQAANGTSAVTTTIVDVSEAAEATGTAAAQVLTSAVEVSRQSRRLGAEITNFLTTVRTA